jgi:hypothetical protein
MPAAVAASAHPSPAAYSLAAGAHWPLCIANRTGPGELDHMEATKH